jgi:hypothetical protein
MVLRQALLQLHRTLLEADRRDYERLRGRVSDGEFLEAVLKDPYFAWLGPLTGAIALLDELEADGKEAGRDWLQRLRALLTPAGGEDFHRRYEASLQRHPEVVVAHGAVMRALSG